MDFGMSVVLDHLAIGLDESDILEVIVTRLEIRVDLSLE